MVLNRRQLIQGAGGALMMVAAKPSWANSPSSNTIRLGVIQPQAGQCATWGVPITRGAQLWAEEQNQNGGVPCGDGKKYTVDVRAYDNVCYVPGDELTAARKAILDDGCQFILQTTTPASRKSVADLVTKNEVLTAAYGTGFISEKYPFLLGAITGIPFSNMVHIAAVLEKHPEIKRVAIIVQNVSYGQAAAAYYAAGCAPFKQRGVEIVYNKQIDAAAKSDMYGLLTPVMDAKPDLIVEELFVPGEKPLMIETLEQLGYKGAYGSESWPLALIKQRMSLDSLSNRLFTAFSVEAAEPSYNARAHAFYQRFVKQFGEADYTVEAANAYVVCATFEVGLSLSKSPTGSAVMKALYDTPTVQHPIFGASQWSGEEIFGAKHHLLTPLPTYIVGKTGSFELTGVVNVDDWWAKNKAAALPVLKSAGQVYT